MSCKKIYLDYIMTLHTDTHPKIKISQNENHSYYGCDCAVTFHSFLSHDVPLN